MPSLEELFEKHPWLAIPVILFTVLIFFFPAIIFFLIFLSVLWQFKEAFDRKDNFLKGDEPLTANPFMSAEEKQAYMKSDKWHMLKQARLAKADYECEACGSTHRLELHHETYERLGDEYLSDLKVVCHSCHTKIHEILGYDRLTEYPISVLKENQNG